MSKGPSPGDETIPRGVNDRKSPNDALNFVPYIIALEQFLMQAVPPLTVSIEGEWGAGKSSFMTQLRKRLNQRDQVTVEFNPWKHQAEEALWAAFILEFIRQMAHREGFTRRDRVRAQLTLLVERSREDWLRAVLFGGGIAALYVVVVLVFVTFGDRLQSMLGVIGVTSVSGIAIAVWVRRNVIERTKNQLQSYLTTAEFDERVSFIEKFNEELKRILDAYVGPDRRVFVFIDDIDRCEITKVADLIESLHLMVPDDRRLVFLIGMDREMVNRALLAKHGDTLDHLNPESKNTYPERYLQKFIQIPFVIPRISTENVDDFLNNMMTLDRGHESDSPEPSPGSNWSSPGIERFKQWFGLRASRGRDTRSVDEPPEPYAAPSDDLRVTGWSQDRLRSMTKLAAPVFNYNPRQLKRFVNLYSLSALLSHEVGRAEAEVRRSEGEAIRAGVLGAKGTQPSKQRRGAGERTDRPTMDQIGKFVIITLRWPRLLQEIRRNPKLLTTLTLIGLRRYYWTPYCERLEAELPAVDGENDDGTGRLHEGDASGVIDDEPVRHRELEALPDLRFSEEDDELKQKELESLLDVLLAGLYEENAWEGEPTASRELDREDALDELVGRFSSVFEEQVERLRDAPTRDNADWFFETLGPENVLRATDADSGYSLASEATVRRLLETSPLPTAVDDVEYRQLIEYRRAIEAYPYSPWLRVDLANLLSDLGRTEEAENQFEAALDLDPSGTSAHESYGDFLASQGRIEEATTHYLELHTYDVQDHIDRGDLLDEEGRPEEAEAHYLAAIELDPHDAVAHLNYGVLLHNQGRTGEAVGHYQQALDLEPDNALAHVNFANLVADEGRVDEAEHHYQQALDLEPDNAMAHINLANLLAESGRADRAEHHYQQALDLEPDDTLAHMNYGYLLSEEGRADDAEHHYERALELEPDDALAHINYGYHLSEAGRTEEALYHYRRALDLEPDNALAHNNYGYTLIEQGRLEEAEPYCRRALELDPTDPNVQGTNARLRHLQGRLAEAGEHYRKAEELGNDHPDYHRNYAEFLEEQGRDEYAEQHRRRLRELATP